MRRIFFSLLAIFLMAPQSECFAIEVVNACICRDVRERVPMHRATSFSADVGAVWCWAKIESGDGTKIYHVWYHGDTIMARVELNIESQLYRTFSSKNIWPPWVGPWRVEIVDQDGVILESLEFVIEELL